MKARPHALPLRLRPERSLRTVRSKNGLCACGTPGRSGALPSRCPSSPARWSAPPERPAALLPPFGWSRAFPSPCPAYSGCRRTPQSAACPLSGQEPVCRLLSLSCRMPAGTPPSSAHDPQEPNHSSAPQQSRALPSADPSLPAFSPGTGGESPASHEAAHPQRPRLTQPQPRRRGCASRGAVR